MASSSSRRSGGAFLGVRGRYALIALVGTLLGNASAVSSAPLAKSSSGTIWQRARQAQASDEHRVLKALERVLLGFGDDHDALASRAALLDYLRGRRFDDGRIELLLARLRLDTSWAFDRRLEARLGATLERPWLPPDLRGQGWLDWGSLAALRNDAEAARFRFGRAVQLLWEDGPRARALLGRGWAWLALGDARKAADDFRLASSVADDRRLLVAALWSLALACERGGQEKEAARALRRAGELEQVRARASGRDPFDGIARQPDYEVHAIAALQWTFRADRADDAGQFEAGLGAEQQRCAALWQYLKQAEPQKSPWAGLTRDTWTRCVTAVGEKAEQAPDLEGDEE